MDKKILIITPDGIGLKNFAFSKLSGIFKKRNYKLIYWNSTPFDLEKLNLNSISLGHSVPFKIDLFKRAKIDLELDLFTNRFKSKVYQTYKFPSKSRNIKSFIKNQFVNYYKLRYYNKLDKLKTKLNTKITHCSSYNESLKKLQVHKPDLVFCTNQRASHALPPILAAKSYKIPTACFIFSWDNLPKATKVIDTDFYFVWSKHMKSELQTYYPDIPEQKIRIVGAPQFEPHFSLQVDDIKSFRNKYNLKKDVKYILFSGDDKTTSPKDEQYLEAICHAVKFLNTKTKSNLEILFRRCPVDFSDRYDEVIYKYSTIVTEIKPDWKQHGNSWGSVLPTKNDSSVLSKTIYCSDLVINLGSSMVFDAVCHNKPCAYINFNPKNIDLKNWSVEKIYQFKHFESMPNKEAVIWINSKKEIADKILEGLQNPEPYVKQAKKWFEVINQHPPNKASQRIYDAINDIITNR